MKPLSGKALRGHHERGLSERMKTPSPSIPWFLFFLWNSLVNLSKELPGLFMCVFYSFSCVSVDSAADKKSLVNLRFLLLGKT